MFATSGRQVPKAGASSPSPRKNRGRQNTRSSSPLQTAHYCRPVSRARSADPQLNNHAYDEHLHLVHSALRVPETQGPAQNPVTDKAHATLIGTPISSPGHVAHYSASLGLQEDISQSLAAQSVHTSATSSREVSMSSGINANSSLLDSHSEFTAESTFSKDVQARYDSCISLTNQQTASPNAPSPGLKNSKSSNCGPDPQAGEGVSAQEGIHCLFPSVMIKEEANPSLDTIFGTALRTDRGYVVQAKGVHTEHDIDEEEEELKDQGQQMCADFHKRKAEYIRQSSEGNARHRDEVELAVSERQYHTNLRKRAADNIVDPEELDKVKNSAIYKAYQNDEIVRVNKARAIRAEIEHNRNKRRRKDPSDAKKKSNKIIRSWEEWRRGSHRFSEAALAEDYETEDDELSDSGGKSLIASDMFAVSKKNQQAPEEPKFVSKDSRKAVTEIISASLARQFNDKAEKNAHRINCKDDREKVRLASKEFARKNKPRPVGANAWKVERLLSLLKTHQVIAVGFMRKLEKQVDEPRGGILADDMGLGKTVEVIGCIVDGRPTEAERKKGRGTTLIVVPASLIKHWEEELNKHAAPEFLGSVLTYRAKSRKASNDLLSVMKMHDIIITTYADVVDSYPKDMTPDKWASDEREIEWLNHFEKEKGPLHKMHFHRMVVDEGHWLKDRKSRSYRAVRSLCASHRWLVSACPISNRIEEIYSYWKILHKQYTGSWHTFRKNYCGASDRTGKERMTEALKPYILRRTGNDTVFGMPIQKLPPIKKIKLICEPNQFEDDLHDKMVHYYARNDGALVLNLINSLRKMASHPLLCQDEFEQLLPEEVDDLRASYAETFKNGTENQFKILRSLNPLSGGTLTGRMYGKNNSMNRYLDALDHGRVIAPSSMKQCEGCGETSKTVVHFFPCRHSICEVCQDDMRLTSGSQCPCGTTIVHTDNNNDGGEIEALEIDGAENTVTLAKRDPNKDWLRMKGIPIASTKTLAMKLQILDWFQQAPDDKIVVFTEFAEMIQMLEKICGVEKWEYAKLHGSMSLDKREDQLRRFRTDPKVKILLSTTKTGGLGLNLACANKVILMESWWNEAINNQCFARIYRDGQTKPCECVSIFLKGTIDNHVEKIVKFKLKRISQVDISGKEAETTYEKLMEIFDPEHGFIIEDDTHVSDHEGLANPEGSDDDSDFVDDELDSDN